MLDCRKHFETVIEEAYEAFTTDKAKRALDEWMTLVIDSAKEIKDYYPKRGLREAAPVLWESGSVLNHAVQVSSRESCVLRETLT